MTGTAYVRVSVNSNMITASETVVRVRELDAEGHDGEDSLNDHRDHNHAHDLKRMSARIEDAETRVSIR